MKLLQAYFSVPLKMTTRTLVLPWTLIITLRLSLCKSSAETKLRPKQHHPHHTGRPPHHHTARHPHAVGETGASGLVRQVLLPPKTLEGKPWTLEGESGFMFEATAINLHIPSISHPRHCHKPQVKENQIKNEFTDRQFRLATDRTHKTNEIVFIKKKNTISCTAVSPNLVPRYRTWSFTERKKK